MSASFIVIEYLLVSLALYLYLKASHRFHWFDVPDEERKIHQSSKPTSAGLIFIIPVLIGCFFLLPLENYIVFILLLSFVPLIVGGVDDFYNISSQFRLHIQWIVSLILIGLVINFETAQGLMMIVYFIGIIWWLNLFNFMDGSDGMATIQAILPLFCYYFLFQDTLIAPLIILLLVALIAFLPFNFPHSKMFMGDSGSLSVAFLVAIIALFGLSNNIIDEIEVLSIHLVFIVDSTLTLFMRWRKGHKLTQAHHLHLYQSLIFHGKSHWLVAMLYAIATLFILLLTLYLHIKEYDLLIRSIILACEMSLLIILWLKFVDKRRFELK